MLSGEWLFIYTSTILNQEMKTLENTLVKWLVPIEGKKYRCFSHKHHSPRTVGSWVSVSLKGLGDPVLFDEETMVLLNGSHNVDFIISTKRAVPILHAIVYLPGEGGTGDECQQGPELPSRA